MELILQIVTPDASGKEYICNQKSKKMIKAICLPTNVDEKQKKTTAGGLFSCRDVLTVDYLTLTKGLNYTNQPASQASLRHAALLAASPQ